MYGGLKSFCGGGIVGAEEMDEILCGEEHGCFLLRFDGAAVLFGRGKLAQLRRDGDIDVEIRDVTECEGVFVGELPAGFAVRVQLPAGEERDVRFHPPPGLVGVLELGGELVRSSPWRRVRP